MSSPREYLVNKGSQSNWMKIKSVHGLKTVLMVMESCFTGQESHKVHSPSSFSALCVGSFKTFLSSLVEKIGSILPQKYQKCFFLLPAFSFQTLFMLSKHTKSFIPFWKLCAQDKNWQIKMVVVWPMVKILQENYNNEPAVAK